MRLALVLQTVLALRPDLSPGATRPTTAVTVCATPWRADPIATLPPTLWRDVLARYQVAWADRAAYQPVFVVPSALGGVVALENVAPLPMNSVWNAARKIEVAHKVYDELCAGRLQLPEAQTQAGVGWETAWRTYFAR